MYILYKDHDDNVDSGSFISQCIVRYAWKILKYDIKPDQIVERNFPTEINKNIPSVYDLETKQYHLGKQAVLDYFCNKLNEPTVVKDAMDWYQNNKNYRIQDDYFDKVYRQKL